MIHALLLLDSKYSIFFIQSRSKLFLDDFKTTPIAKYDTILIKKHVWALNNFWTFDNQSPGKTEGTQVKFHFGQNPLANMLASNEFTLWIIIFFRVEKAQDSRAGPMEEASDYFYIPKFQGKI